MTTVRDIPRRCRRRAGPAHRHGVPWAAEGPGARCAACTSTRRATGSPTPRPPTRRRSRSDCCRPTPTTPAWWSRPPASTAWRADGSPARPRRARRPGGVHRQRLHAAGAARSTRSRPAYRDDSARRGGPMMLLAAPTLPGRGLNPACAVYGVVGADPARRVAGRGARQRVAVHAGRDQRRRCCTRRCRSIGTHAGVWTTAMSDARTHRMGDAGRRRRALGRATAARRPALRPRPAARRRHSQRRRRLPVLDARGDRRRHRPAPAPAARRDRELRQRRQHRRGGAHRQRVRRRHRAHRRPPPLEPARRHGDRPLPAAAPSRHAPPNCWRFAADAGLTVVAVDNVPGRGAAGGDDAAARLPAGVRPGGSRHHRRRARRARRSRCRSPSSARPAASTPRVAAGIAMHAWIRQWADLSRAW